MRFLAAAIVTVALCAASFAADAGLADDATGWGVSAGLALDDPDNPAGHRWKWVRR